MGDTAGPTNVPAAEDDVLELGPRRQASRGRTVVAGLVAVAVIGVLGVRYLGHDPRSPVAAPTPTISTSPTSSATPPPVAAGCAREIPSSWTPVVAAATTRITDVGYVSVVAATPGGGVVVQYTRPGDGAAGRSARLGYLAPRATTVRPLGRYGLPAAAADRAQSFGLNVDVAGRIAAVTVSGAARRLVDGSAQVPDTVQRIEVVDLMSAARRVVASRGDYAAGSTLIGGYALDGHVYWQVRSPGASGRDRIYDYDAATGRTSLTDLGTFFGLTRSAAGVAWTDASIDRPARLPRLVQAALDRDRTITFSTFVSDGSAWAWATPTGDLAWWSPASGRVVHVRGLLGRGARQPGIPLAVAGPFVWYQPVGGVDGGRIVDVRSGANVSAPRFLVGIAGQLVGEPLTVPRSAGTTGAAVMRLDPTTLPRLRC